MEPQNIFILKNFNIYFFFETNRIKIKWTEKNNAEELKNKLRRKL